MPESNPVTSVWPSVDTTADAERPSIQEFPPLSLSKIEAVLTPAKRWLILMARAEGGQEYDGCAHNLLLTALESREQTKEALKQCVLGSDLELGFSTPAGIEGIACEGLWSLWQLCYRDDSEADLDKAIRALELYVKDKSSRLDEEQRSRKRPRWDAEARQLWFGDVLCRDYSKKQAPDQEAILTAFEAAGWPERIPAPQLNDLNYTLRHLRKGLAKNAPLRFSADGTSKGIRWEEKK
jgi:hypothetical protein